MGDDAIPSASASPGAKSRGSLLQDWPMTGNMSICPAPVDLAMMLNFLIWNVRGASKQGYCFAIMRDMKKHYKLDIVVVLEPRISDNRAIKTIRNWGFKHSCCMEVEGVFGWNLDFMGDG
ncbi:hypothetical protein K1719_022035 [Acacia pycnantha]|nr:hypothetical protein K1719_022035 [Acacia pycnantha]